MRVGIFGGTFDPVHFGHLIVAEWCREQGKLDQVLFVPAARPPHKPDHDITPFDQRVEMLQFATAGNVTFQIDELEKKRPGPSYTVETLRTLRESRPSDEFFLMLGADSINDFPQWYEPVAIVELATLMITARPNYELPNEDEIRSQLPEASRDHLECLWIRVPLIDIASTEIRQRVGQNRSIRYLLPAAVEAYVKEKKLYKS